MSEDLERYLHEQLTTSQSKYCYFQLAAAGAAIAFAVRLTGGSLLTSSQLPLGLAVMCWGFSFHFGSRHIQWIQATMQANFAALIVARGAHPDSPTHPGERQAAAEGARIAAHENAASGNRDAHRQTRLLLLGSLLFIAWHIWEMALRTPRISVHLSQWIW